MSNLYKKEVVKLNSIDEGLEFRNGKNDLSTLNNETKILIVGSLIPRNLFYYFAGQNRFLYECIRDAREVDFSEFINNKNIEKIRELLIKNQIAFIDVCKCALIKEGSNRDKNIKEFVFEEKIIDVYKTNKNLKVYCISRDVEKILKLKGVDCEYHHFFRGGKGISREMRKAEWIKIFQI